MAGIKIHQYPLERTSIGDEDYYDIDYWTGSSYQSAKIKGSTLKNVLGANYIDITTFISGYDLTDKDAGKLITNSNTNFRTLVIPSGLALPNNMITVKGRIAIQPETGVNITLPDGSTITDPAQFTCVADEVYILHKSAFSGDDYILVSVKKSENIGTNDLIITDTIRELQVATDGTFQIVTNDPNNSTLFKVGENSNERFGGIEINSVTYDKTTAEPNPTNNGAGIITRINPNEYEIESRSDIGNAGTKRSRIYTSPNEVVLEKSSAGKLTLNSLGASNTFEDLRATKKGLEYSADYSANFSVRSLIDKGYVDTGLSTKIGAVIEDTTPQLGGDLDLNNNDINGTGNVDITGNVIADIVQLKGGTGTQGEMSWSTDEETVKLIMDGTTLYMGQDTFVHVRNNTASIITKGTAVYATGTLGASGRITVAPMIADGTIAGRLFIGLAAEDIAIGADGQVCSYGKIRGINTTAYNDGDVLWISPTVAGQLTATEPTAPNLKIATAFVIHDATNGTLMVRAEQGNDLHSDQRVQVSGLTDGDVLTWSNANQRWENEAPTSENIYTNNGTIGSGRVATLTDTLSFAGGRVSFDTTTNGILLPRLTTAQMNAIASPVTNTILYNTDLNGLYRYNGSAWVALSAGYGIIEVRDASGYPTFYADLQTAINATGDVDTVYIYSDIQVTAQISIPNRTSLTIEMNGHRIWCNTTSGDFNLFRFATSGGAGTDRIFTLNGGGTLEQVGTVVSSTNAAVIHFFQASTQRQLQIFAGTTLIKSENAFTIYNQANLRLIDGGIWYSTNKTISLNTAAAIIRNANIDIYTGTDQFSGTYDNCHLNTRYGYFWIGGSIINSRITGAILQSGTNIGMIICSGNDTIANNIIENGTGAVNWAINCYYAGSSGRISNNTINSTHSGINLRYGSAFNNYIYAGSSRAITKTSLGAGYAIGNVCITNATNVEAMYTTGGAGVINNYCISLNASNTAAAFRTDGANENVFGNTFIVSNASAANVNRVGNVYYANNTLGQVGTGITGAGTNLMTNTVDSYGNIRIG